MDVQTTPLTQKITNSVNNEIEIEQERQLKDKYPNLTMKGGSAILQKRMQAKHLQKAKYFDSGDYNMALSKKKTASKVMNDAANSEIQSEVEPTISTENIEKNIALSLDDKERDLVENDLNSYSKRRNSRSEFILPPVAVLATATSPVAQELLLEQEVNQAALNASRPKDQLIRLSISEETNRSVEVVSSTLENVPLPSTCSLHESVHNCTGVTMATPDNVPAVARKKSIMQQAAGSISIPTPSSPGITVSSHSMYNMTVDSPFIEEQ